MYNETFKKRYLDENEYRNSNIRNYMETQFGKVEHFEESLGKDAYDFTTKEIITYYKLRCSTSLETLMVLNNQFAAYTQFALANNLVADAQNHYEEIDNEALYECINRELFEKNIYTREQINRVADQTANACEAYILYAFFEGICGEQFSDIANLTKENFVGNRVHLPSGKVLTVSDELLEKMRIAADEYMCTTYCADGSLGIDKYKADDPKIIKEKRNVYTTGAHADRIRVYNRLAKISDVYGLPGITSKSLMESGRIDMIKKLMKEDGTDDLRTIIKNHREEIEYRYGRFTSIPRYILKYGEYYNK